MKVANWLKLFKGLNQTQSLPALIWNREYWEYTFIHPEIHFFEGKPYLVFRMGDPHPKSREMMETWE